MIINFSWAWWSVEHRQDNGGREREREDMQVESKQASRHAAYCRLLTHWAKLMPTSTDFKSWLLLVKLTD